MFGYKLPFILDGSTGTSLMKTGLKPGVKTYDFVLEHPSALEEIQRGYLQAGSDSVIAATFGIAEGTHPIDADKVRRVVEISRKVCGGSPLGLDLSPIGKYLYPYGDGDFEAAAERYGQLIRAAGQSVDYYIVETSIQAAEARAAAVAVRSFTAKPVIVSLTVGKGGRTLSGDALLPSMFALVNAGADAFGVNCAFGPDLLREPLLQLVPYAEALGIPLVAKPNAGVPDEHGGYLPLELFAENMRAMYSGGVEILGGCCGTGAEHISAIKQITLETKVEKPAPADIKFDRIVCNSRAWAQLDPDRLPEPIECGDFTADDIDEQENDAALIRLTPGDADALTSQLPFIQKPFALCGDEAEAEKFNKTYCGKAVFVNARTQ